MAKFKNFEQWQKDFIKENAANMTLKELSEKLKITITSIFNYCTDNYIPTKNSHKKGIDSEKKNLSRPAGDYIQIGSPFGIASSLKH